MTYSRKKIATILDHITVNAIFLHLLKSNRFWKPIRLSLAFNSPDRSGYPATCVGKLEGFRGWKSSCVRSMSEEQEIAPKKNYSIVCFSILVTFAGVHFTRFANGNSRTGQSTIWQTEHDIGLQSSIWKLNSTVRLVFLTKRSITCSIWLCASRRL